MPLSDIPLNILQEKNQLATTERFIWLYEIAVPTDPPTMYRLTRQPEAVNHGGFTYSPFPISHDIVTRDATGDLPTTSVTASNMSREIIGELEAYEGLVGQTVRIILTHSLLDPSSSQSVIEERFEVLSSTATADSVTLSLGSSNLFDSFIPKARMARFHCRHQYRGPECGYALDPSNANYLSGCDKTLNGLNGCVKHGASYTAASLTPLHPERFGGFPGIPVPTTGGSI